MLIVQLRGCFVLLRFFPFHFSALPSHLPAPSLPLCWPVDVGGLLAMASVGALRSIPPVYLVHFNLVCYSLLWWSVQPVFPYLSSQLGASPVEIGYLTSASSLFQLVGSPVMGRLMDARGPKLALLMSNAFAALSYVLLSQSTSIPLLYLSQLPTFFLSTLHASQVYLTHLTTAERRAESLGSLSLSYGIGMVAGPTIGGALSTQMSYEALAALAGAASAVVFVLMALALPPKQAPTTQDAAADRAPLQPATKPAAEVLPSVPAAERKEGQASGFFDALRLLLASPLSRSLLLIKLLASFGVSVYRSAFMLLVKDSYGLSAQQSGWILSSVGLLTIFTNTALIAPVNRRYPPASIISATLICLVLSFLPVPFSLTLPSLLLTLVPVTVATSIAATVLTSTLTTASPAGHAGAVIGVDQSVSQVSRMAAPVVAGLLLEGGQREVGLMCGSMFALAYGLSRWTPWRPAELNKKVAHGAGDTKVRVE